MLFIQNKHKIHTYKNKKVQVYNLKVKFVQIWYGGVIDKSHFVIEI